ncbi:uncharacterized protein LOC117322117 [Pecten maximus]|uniref:uncharacterized protein LOC117322117 n=1 Tax=Pecten maximus TaxID=6579 RepID=UPI0014589C4A|nr:uncharacterized protein LOC117322117 [Pecten maximus]
MTDPENRQQLGDAPTSHHDSEEKLQQNIEIEALVKENGESDDNCTRIENDRHSPSSLKDVEDTEADHGRNIISRMQNYTDMPNINDNKIIIVESKDITVHNTPVNHVKSSKERSTNHGSKPEQHDDPQPGSSSSHGDNRQLSSIDSTIYTEPETEQELEPEQTTTKKETEYIEETWEHSKARRYRRRAIFCTDMYNNMGDMAHEKELSEALNHMKERWNRRAKLDRKLSDLVQSNETDPTMTNGDVSVEENIKQELKQRQKKLNMKDVYKELRLMRQVVAACVRTDSSVVKERQKDKSISITSPTEHDKEDKGESANSENETATEEKPDANENDESVNSSSEMEATQTDENTENCVETDASSSKDQDEITAVHQLSNTDIGQDGDTENSDNDTTEGHNNDSCEDEENEQMADSDDEKVALDKTVEEFDLGTESDVGNGRRSTEPTNTTAETCEKSTSETYELSAERSTERSLLMNNHNECRDTVPSRLSYQTAETPDEETFSRKDSTSSMDWASTYSNMNDVILHVDDYKGDSVVGCVVYTETDSPDPARCILVCPADVPSAVNIYENVVGNILHIDPRLIQGGDEGDNEITVAIPFVKDEMQYYQEPVLRVLDSRDRWSDFPCRETLYQRDDDSNLFVLMAKFTGPTTCVVVAMPIVDDIVFTDRMTRFHSTVDSEIILTCPVSARINSKNVHVELKVLPVVPSILEETKSSFDTDRQKLYNAGAIVTLKFYDDHPQTIYMHLPCARPPVPSRPMTGSKRVSSCLGTPDSGYRSTSRGGQMSRKGSTFGKFVEPSQEKECHLIRFASCMATKVKTLTSDDVTVDDQAVFSVHEKSSTSVVLEVTEELPSKVIQDIVPRLLTNIEYQNVQICLAHNKKCLNELALSCDRAKNVNSRQMMRLEAENVVRTKAVKLKEGDTLCLCFRGNISSISKHRTIFRYYGIHGIHTAWTIDVVDRYCQRSLSSFCGFLQMFVWKSKQPFDCQRIDLDNKSLWNLVTEMPISLPKTVLKFSTKLVRAPVTVRTEGTITPEFLENLALAIGEGWLSLANCLNIDHPRIQSIKQQHKGKHKELARDILMTWFKRSLFVKEKTSALIMALRNCGRDDLADALRDSSKRYRREQARHTRDNKMETVILSVCKSSQVVSRWKDIASMLDMDESEIQTINAENTDEVSKCRGMLSLWKQKQNGYGIRKLVKCLKHLGLDHIADHLTSMMTKTPS